MEVAMNKKLCLSTLLLSLLLVGCGTNTSSENPSSEIQSSEIASSETTTSYENEQGLDFLLQDDGTYAVSIGNACYLSEVTIPSTYRGRTVTTVASYFISKTYEQVSKVKKVNLPNTIKRIEEYAFSFGKKGNLLESIDLPDSIEYIGDDAFESCEHLESITLPKNLNYLGNSVYNNCSNLKTVSFPSHVEHIGSNVFSGCKALEYNEDEHGYYLGNDNNKYVYLAKIKNKDILNINQNCEFIDHSIRNVSMVVTNSNPNFVFENTLLLTKDKKELILCSKNASGDVVVTDGVESFRNFAFEGCTLDSITIPFGCKFSYYSAGSITLYKFMIESTEEWYEKNANYVSGHQTRLYNNATKEEITVLKLSDSTEYLQDSFRGFKGITKVIIPSSVIRISNGYMLFMYCEHIEEVDYLGTIDQLTSIEFFESIVFTTAGFDVIHCTDGDYPVA